MTIEGLKRDLIIALEQIQELTDNDIVLGADWNGYSLEEKLKELKD